MPDTEAESAGCFICTGGVLTTDLPGRFTGCRVIVPRDDTDVQWEEAKQH